MLETYVLHITKECNMMCSYCYEKDKTSHYNWEEIKIIIDNIILYNKHFNIEFLGGEPTLRIDLIVNTVTYLESKEDVFVEDYFLTTNGIYINDDLKSLLKEYPKVKWIASVDGNKFMNSLRILKNGMNSYEYVIDNFHELEKHLNRDENQQLACHIVTHPYNIGYLNDGINDLYGHGFRRFAIGTIESTIIIDDEYCNEFIKQLKHISDRIKRGELADIHIGVLESLKPKTDERHYIRDSDNKVILETYGRMEGDIKDSEAYKTLPSSSLIQNNIYYIRETVYNYHNEIK